MAYNSAYKGSEIDAAVGAVKSKEKTWDGKMPAVTGTAGQMVGFDSDGNPVAQDVPATGLTEEEADGKYLKLTGGTVTGETTVILGANTHFAVTDASGSGATYKLDASASGARIVYGGDTGINIDSGGELTFASGKVGFRISKSSGISFGGSRAQGLASGTEDTDAATVAQAIPKLTIITLPASGWDSSTKSQTIAVAGVDADETKQWIECTGCVSNQSAFDDASIKITAFAADSLTFTASTVPTVDLKVGVKIEAVNDVTPPKIYGAEWDGSSSTAWTRTDSATTFSDPVPAVNNGTGSSPFDNIMPWAGIKRVTDETAGELVEIPKFWYKWTKDGSKLKLQIASKAADGFHISPAHMDRGDGKGERDVVYIGRYPCVRDYKSTTGEDPYRYGDFSANRSGIHSLGSSYWQTDYAMRVTIWMLYLVEFADWNSKEKIGCGGCSNVLESYPKNGQTDAMQYCTGTTGTARAAGGVTQYRYIENLWGFIYEWMDGCYCNDDGWNVILNPANFSNDSGGVNVGAMPSTGYPTAMKVGTASGFEWCLLPDSVGGSDSTYITDYCGVDASNPFPYVGSVNDRSNVKASVNGLFSVFGNMDEANYGSFMSRLMKLP